MTTRVTCSIFDHLPDGREVNAFRLDSGKGVVATVLDYGAGLQSLITPDRSGSGADIVLGHDRIAPYLEQPTYLGVTVGRYANRIVDGRFMLDGKAYQLAGNDGGQALHGGVHGFDKHLWMVEDSGADTKSAWVRLGRVSPDGEEGYPGDLTVAVTYRLTRDNELVIDYEATTTAPTVVNLTNHALFNLSGVASGKSAMHAHLTVYADAFTPVDERLIPVGDPRPVAGSPFDFRKARAIVARLRDASDAQIRIGRGYDHNYCLRGGRTIKPKQAARLVDPDNGRGLLILTTEPGLQVYSGNFLNGTLMGKGEVLYRQGDGIALEAQTFPDAPNRPDFPSARLDPGQVYRQTTVHRFFTV
jgi:aldose 1-epimerase